VTTVTIPFVDLFCGAGGLSIGFEQAGFKSVYAIDNDPFACQSYALNHPDTFVKCENIESISGQDILQTTGLKRIPLLIGGPNCQGVSLRGKRNPSDPKNATFFHFRRLVEELNPDWFMMENVPGLLHRHNRELLTTIFRSFSSIGYTCGGEVLLAADYGVPQLRYRFILIGNRHDQPIVFPNATHRCSIDPDVNSSSDFIPDLEIPGVERLTVGNAPLWTNVYDAISDLPPIPNGGGSKFIPYSSNSASSLTDYQRYCREKSDGFYNHICHKTNEQNIELIKHIPPGKNWRSIPEELRPPRFKKVALKDHTTTYKRLEWYMPSRTITAYFNNITAGAFTHPNQHRGISVREAARLQSFPDHYVFEGSLARQCRQVGNAVPCLMAYKVASLMLECMSGARSIQEVHSPAVEYDEFLDTHVINRPLKGMRFNLDKHLVRN